LQAAGNSAKGNLPALQNAATLLGIPITGVTEKNQRRVGWKTKRDTAGFVGNRVDRQE
jgi:hypothetical protein